MVRRITVMMVASAIVATGGLLAGHKEPAKPKFCAAAIDFEGAPAFVEIEGAGYIVVSPSLRHLLIEGCSFSSYPHVAWTDCELWSGEATTAKRRAIALFSDGTCDGRDGGQLLDRATVRP